MLPQDERFANDTTLNGIFCLLPLVLMGYPPTMVARSLLA